MQPALLPSAAHLNNNAFHHGRKEFLLYRSGVLPCDIWKKKRKSSNLSFRTFLTCVHSSGLLYLNVTGQLHRPPHVSGDTNTLHCWGATLTWKQFSLFFWRCWRVDQCSMCSWKMHVLGYPVVSTDKFWGPFSCLFSFVSRNTARYLHWADVVFWVVLELHRLFENSAL